MKSKQIRNSLLLLLTALIWGIAFVAQSTGGSLIGPYSFNGIRSFIGAIVLIPAIMFLDKAGLTSRKPTNKDEMKLLMKGGVTCGVIMFVASNVQQLGLYYGSSAGKAGFLTACYILIVPILGLFMKKKCGWNIWIGVLIALVGLYLLCMEGSFSLNFADGLVLCCAVAFALHILAVDYFSPKVDGVRMSCIQFFVCGLLTAIPAFFVDMGGTLANFSEWIYPFTMAESWITLLYAGVLSCGVAYTLQIIGQNGLNPTVASLLMSLESVFAVIAGWLILGQTMGVKELLGCGLIFVAIILAQVNFTKKAA